MLIEGGGDDIAHVDLDGCSWGPWMLREGRFVELVGNFEAISKINMRRWE